MTDNAFERELSVRWKKEADKRENCAHKKRHHDIVEYVNPKTQQKSDFIEITCEDCGIKSYYNLELLKERHDWFAKLSK